MFSGIVEAFGKVVGLNKGNESCVLTLESVLTKELKQGSSIAVNGVCLTVVSLAGDKFTLDVMPETVTKTNLGQLEISDKVNLERPLAADGRFEGHIVQGHVDAVGTISEKREVENAHEIRISAPANIMELCVEKGSITVDGISLTLIEVNKDNFTVSIIPYTSENTTLGFKNAGDQVNLEADILGKYIMKYLSKVAIEGKLRENFTTN